MIPPVIPPYLEKRKYECKQCHATFVASSDSSMFTNKKCQECGGKLEIVQMGIVDYVDPIEHAKSLKDSAKRLASFFTKKK